jgi:hypothetical protein
MSLTDLLIPTYRQMLGTLAALLEKAQQQKPQEAESLLEARLAPDMYPLALQIHLSARQAEDAISRLRGESEDERSKRTVQAQGPTMAEAKARLSQALTTIEAVPPAGLDAGAGLEIVIDVPAGSRSK